MKSLRYIRRCAEKPAIVILACTGLLGCTALKNPSEPNAKPTSVSCIPAATTTLTERRYLLREHLKAVRAIDRTWHRRSR